MKKTMQSVKKRGVVLLLVLGLMTMFAMLVLAFMVATSNMAQTSVNIAKSDSVQNSIEEPQNESYQALRTLMTGTNNRLSPIAPFSILENLYGDYSRWVGNTTGNGSWYDNSFVARVVLVTDTASQSQYVRIYRMIQDTDNLYGVAANKSDVWKSYSLDMLFIETGSVLTFGDCLNSNSTYVNLWRSSAASTSTIVSRKVILNPDVYSDNVNNPPGGTLNTWYIEVPLTDSVRRFFVDANLSAIDSVMVRLNQPAYSGTGAGHFDPMNNLDGTSFRDGVNFFTHADDFRIPYMKWANASAPDTIPYCETGSSLLSAQSYWAHLINGLYNPYQANASATASQYVTYNTNGWLALNPIVLGRNGSESVQPVKMHPSYTAPDQRNLFLAWYNGTPQASTALDNSERFSVIPSFHRPDLIKWALNQTATSGSGPTAVTTSIFGCGKTLTGDTINTSTWSGIDALGVLRKMTPRPLQLDHWRFTGSNTGLDLNLFLTNYGNSLGLSSNEINWSNQLTQAGNVRQYTNMYARIFADLIGPNEFAQAWKGAGQTYSFVPYDVDNDNDGVKDGVWIPSGLPIRISEDGTPYATMFSYTVLDMDGRVNVNYAGSWDQLPQFFNGAGALCAYDAVMDVAKASDCLTTSVVAGNPFFDVEAFTTFKSNTNKLATGALFDWVDDVGNTSLGNSGNLLAMRGNGTGPASVSLYHTLKYLGFDQIDSANSLSGRTGVSAFNLLWRRYSDRSNQVHYLPVNSVSSSGIVANTILRSNYEQPGSLYSTTGTQAASAYERWTNGMTHPIFQLTDNANIQTMLNQYGAADPDVSKFIFPYRGKTRITSYTPSPSLYPLFNFADTALRSYDPNGQQIYTYPPKFGENPYRFTAQYQTSTDSPYSWGMLEGLLRYGDSDSQKLSNTLVNDLVNNYSGQLLSNSNYRDLFLAAKSAITTVSSDIPAATMTFVDKETGDAGSGFEGGGAYGIIPIIQKCVLAEFHATFEQKIKDEVTAGTLNAADEQTLRQDLDLLIQKVTTYLVTLLPPETLMGQKIDLNKLSQKSYWLDVKFKNDLFEQAGGVNGGWPMYVDFASIANGDVAKREIHNYGLVKRMEYARGVYLLLMALTYEDRHAGTIYPNAVYPDGTTAKNLSNYFEGAFNLDIDKLTNQTDKDELGRELIANRIAQWCMNLVDFSDPDSTMTPFYYDSNPFDGWWTSKTAYDDVRNCASADRLTKTYIPLFASYDDTFGTDVYTLSPNEAMNRFFLDYYNTPDATTTGTSFAQVVSVDPFPTGETLSYANKIRFLLTAKTVDPSDTSKTVTQDSQFRLVWGMERPDLVLTETLNFHDLGIANTKIPDGSLANSSDSGGDKVDTGSGGSNTNDKHFDQVSRPKGSSYLELVCTANPNIPQTSELYVYEPLKNSNNQFVDWSGNVVSAAGNAAWSWQLRLTKKTPAMTDSAGRQVEFPVW
ncbi:MAG: hypothetical protein PHQ75_10640, partial [Thermoguttaceae bacterium]|nr:hypothetical protein [Thermoguttaceae bacterium]